jgi:hypothetical protein
MEAEALPAYRFDRFVLDLRRGVLLADDAECVLRPKSFALLRLFVESAGRLIDRDEILHTLWPVYFAASRQRRKDDDPRERGAVAARGGITFCSTWSISVRSSCIGVCPVSARRRESSRAST